MNSMILRVRYLYMFDTPDICTIFFHYKLMNFQIVVKEDVRPSPVNTPENCKCDLYIKICKIIKLFLILILKDWGNTYRYL